MALRQNPQRLVLIRITEHTEAMVPAVKEFNARLLSGGMVAQFPPRPLSLWLPKLPGRPVFMEHYLALDEAGAVRGAYVLKRQAFWLEGRERPVGFFSLPISEGTVDRAYAALGVRLLLDAQQKSPWLYGLGMGRYEEPLPKLLRASGWGLFGVPMFFRVVRPVGFLRNIHFLRRNGLWHFLFDVAAFTGVGWAAVKSVQAVRTRSADHDESVAVELVEEFSDWADAVWLRGRAAYGMSAVRDAATLRVLYPKEDLRFIRLKISRGGEPIGWAVLLNTQLSGHRQFGDMRLGSIVDCFSAPQDALPVVQAARKMLEGQGVDLIVSNQLHAAWCDAMTQTGFLRGPSNFIFAACKELDKLLAAAGIRHQDIHMNRGDGDGPINL